VKKYAELFFDGHTWRVMCGPLDFEGSMTPAEAREAAVKVIAVADEAEKRNTGKAMTIDEREELLEWAKAYQGVMQASHSTLSKIYKLVEIAVAALEYGCSQHTMDANCSAGDCDDCSARTALEKIEKLVHGPLGGLYIKGIGG
jgi:hypothetical protein